MNKPKRVSEPPSYFQVPAVYDADPASKHLRMGQWFMNRYMPTMQDDTLYNSTNRGEIMALLLSYYEKYQWNMTP
jgi:hypothetical protein